MTNLKELRINIEKFPEALHNTLKDAKIYDSSSSPEAQVLFIDKKDGYYLKIASSKTLEREAEMTAYFQKKKLGLGYISYLSDQSQDFLLKKKIQGENYLAKQYLNNPKRLCDNLAENLRFLHEQNFEDCPILDHSERYLKKVQKNASINNSNLDFVNNYNIRTTEEAYDYIENKKLLLRNDTLLHGDYCLPNIILDNWKFKGFIDLDCAGVGDRHIDLFWGAWTLNFNIGTDQYRDRFFDAYGRDRIDVDRLKLVGCCEVFG